MRPKNKIEKSMFIGELLDKYPDLGDRLVDKYGFHCVGCMGAAMETLEDGARVHGFSKKKTDEMIADLNDFVVSGKKK